MRIAWILLTLACVQAPAVSAAPPSDEPAAAGPVASPPPRAEARGGTPARRRPRLVPLGTLVGATRGRPDSLFAVANAAYESGDYASAIELYEAIVARGVAHADLYYNLGNARFKQGELGRAIVWYERARRVAPRDDDVRANLELMRSLVHDRQFVRERGRLQKALLFWHGDTTTAESVAAASFLYLVFVSIGVCFVFRSSRAVSKLYARLSLLSPGRLVGLDSSRDLVLGMAFVLVLSAGSAVSALVKHRVERDRRVGIVVDDEAPVFSGPSRDATVQFKVHEGTRVTVRDARTGWVRIELPGDLSGWVGAASLERI